MKTAIFNGLNVGNLPFNNHFTHRIYGNYSIDKIFMNLERIFYKCCSMIDMYAISENSKHYASWYHTHVLVRSSDSDALVEDLKMVVDYRYVNHCKEKVLIKKENSTSITGFKDEFAIINTTEIQGKKEQIHLQEIIGKPNFAVYANKYNDWGIHNNFWTKNIK